MSLDVSVLSPHDYARFPWKNGGGVTTDIAARYRDGASAGDWSAVLWRFGRTAITAPGPFSDLSGFDRWQTVVAGRGLRLDTPVGEVDLADPFTIARYPGEGPIVSRLEAGPVEVVNLIVDRAGAAGHLAVFAPGEALPLRAGTHILYAADGALRLRIGDKERGVSNDHALRIEGDAPLRVQPISGRGVLASIDAA